MYYAASDDLNVGSEEYGQSSDFQGFEREQLVHS